MTKIILVVLPTFPLSHSPHLTRRPAFCQVVNCAALHCPDAPASGRYPHRRTLALRMLDPKQIPRPLFTPLARLAPLSPLASPSMPATCKPRFQLA